MSSKVNVFRPLIAQPDDTAIRYIALTQGQIAVVDAADYEWLNQSNWCAHWNKKTGTFYARRRAGRDGSLIGMHAVIVDAPEGFLPDHRDGDTLNNRRSNLRLATHQQNQQNKGAQINSQTGLRGVYPHRTPDKYVSQITKDGKRKHLGVFDSREAAAAAYAAEAKVIHGEFFHGSR